MHESIHVQTAALMFQVPESEVTEEMRVAARRVNHHLLFGGEKTLNQCITPDAPRGCSDAQKFGVCEHTVRVTISGRHVPLNDGPAFQPFPHSK